jgi:glycosyltransferase involved in cell wall biosynthesis
MGSQKQLLPLIVNQEQNKSMKTIVLHDYFDIKGGGEKLILTLVKSLNSDLCFGFKGEVTYSFEDFQSNQLIDLNAYSNKLGWRSIKLLSTFKKKTAFIHKYDTVIYSGLSSIIAVHNHPNDKNILYCHTIPRFVYDLKDYYLSKASWWKKPLLQLLINYVKLRYERAIEEMDVIIANSDNVKRRIKKYLNRDAIVIYPPVKVDNYKWIKQGDYYLSTARVESYKRVELVVRAFIKMPDKKLIVASGGGDLERLQNLATDYSNISFTGWCDDEQWQQLIGKAIATIYIPIDEDFGMSPVESMAAGKPVIGVAEGGLLETVVHGETGVLIQDVSVDALVEAVFVMSKDKALTMRAACEKRARLFRTQVFLEKMRKLINDQFF